ncbi:MAG TPA: HAMP domain-containing sensor histidine kinase [Coleofasciculaceae cyanobacterium]
MYKWYLPTLSEIVALGEGTQDKGVGQGGIKQDGIQDGISPERTSWQFRSPAQQQLRAEREWSGAIAALKQLLQQTLEFNALAATKRSKQSAASTGAVQGIVLSGPFPILDQPDLLANFAAWTFTVGTPGEMPVQLLPSVSLEGAMTNVPIPTLPLLSSDPLAAEQFCLAITETFGVILVLGETAAGEPAFLFSFDPTVVQQTWRSLQARLRMAAPYALPPLDGLMEQFVPKAPDYRLVSQFSRLLLDCLPQPSDLEGKPAAQVASQSLQGVAQSLAADPASLTPAQPSPARAASSCSAGKVAHSAAKSAKSVEPRFSEKRLPSETSSDTELLQAIAHEVRTPLTTIRTLTRLLLRRKELNPDVIKRLEVIDRECTEQIDRFNLIFRAVELETAKGKNSLASLAPISLSQVLQQTVPRWQQQASQHNHTLEVNLPQKLPMVVTDPTMLDQVLTGLVDRFTHSLPPGSHIQMQVSQAGHQLKLQLESHPQAGTEEQNKAKFGLTPTLKSLGQMLMFQPETGNLSLSMAVTKNLFQALGGKLIVKQRPHQGEILTIFLPLENRKSEE